MVMCKLRLEGGHLVMGLGLKGTEVVGTSSRDYTFNPFGEGKKHEVR